ncbi:MAG TPA: acyl-CoA dehydrogenase family protein [Granulicella sp.]|jgi:alkylation response protein AidB-like acyl-CoA dehydrogenase|nr:acyl-CoA dehydrogenase family protein [Granulicella sp.]
MATVTAVVPTAKKTAGGAFLIQNATPAECFFPEDFTEEHRQIAQTTADFAVNEIVPVSDAIEAKDFAVTRRLIREASELGLTSVDIPEEYGGLDMDKVSSAIVAENIAKQGSFSVAFSAHVGIGTLPIVWYGTAEQKKRYLPKLASGEFVGAYALSESTSGSDAMNPRSRAVLSEDGRHYILNGEKMWITNGGFADIYTVFAKCAVPGGEKAGEEKLTAFLVERGTPGFSVGKEEHKLGIRGSSTCPLILKDCKVPVENLLGEVGKGHHIAFNVLNVGRYKLGAAAVGGARTALGYGIQYAKDRKAFGKSISEFGLIQEKIADCAVGIFAGEALCYRTVGMIDQALSGLEGEAKHDAKEIQRQIESYAVECSIVKVWASELLDMVVDHVVQIYAGYGYVEEYPAERAYRDSRINRIFEGTNEINRLIITGWLMKSAMAGKLALMPAIKQVMDEVMAGPVAKEEREGALAEEFQLLAQAKKLTLFAAGAATQRYMAAIAEEQEVMAAIADCITEVFAMESVILRAEKIGARGTGAGPSKEIAVAMARIYAARAMETIELSARRVIAAVAEGDTLRTQLAILRRLAKYDPADTIALRRQVARHMVKAGKYAL